MGEKNIYGRIFCRKCIFFVCFPLFIYISTEMSQRSSSWERLAPSGGDVAGFPSPSHQREGFSVWL